MNWKSAAVASKTVTINNLSSLPSSATLGAARFTVITPGCVRLEYCAALGFIDDATLFAVHRQERDAQAKITQNAAGVLIESSVLRLVYREDGKAFHPGNLEITFLHGDAPRSWHPGDPLSANLGGPLPTLDNVSAAVPLGLGLLSRNGWFLVDDSGTALLRDGWATQRPGGSPPGSRIGEENLIAHPDIDWYFFGYGLDYRAALHSLSRISGAAALPRREIFGSWYCRWHPYTSDGFREVVREYGEQGYPLDVLVFDMDWHTQDAQTGYGVWTTLGWTGYTWNRTLLPDAELLVRELKDAGLSVVLNDHPADGFRENEEHYAAFQQMLPPGSPANAPFQAGNRVYMEAFLRAAHHPLEDQGIDFWWLDWQQDWLYPYVLGVPGLRHLPWLNHLWFHDSERTGRRGQTFSRWGGWGSHRTPIQFSGDTDSNWEVLEFLVPFSTASGNAGCFYWAHDTGGFRGEAGPENFTRWIQFGALSACLRVHSAIGGADRRPWAMEEPFASANRLAYQLRARLIPYLYSSARQCFEDTVPLLRAMYLDHPDEEAAYQVPGQYLLGDHLLAAPITQPGEGPELRVEKAIWFPEGEWHDFFTGEKIAVGPCWEKISAGICEIPLYLRAGAPISLQPFDQRPTQCSGATLVVRCVPTAAGECVWYEDDGQTQGYLTGEFARTTLSCSVLPGEILLTMSATTGTYSGQLTARACRFELCLPAEESYSAWLDETVVTMERSDDGWQVIASPERPITEAIKLRLTRAAVS